MSRCARVWVVVALGLWALAASPPSLSAQRSLVIERFDATIRVEESGWIDVREEIRVRFAGSWNGIFRTIPVQYTTPQGFTYKLLLDDVSVVDENGRPLEFRSSRERHYRKLKIRVPGARDATRTVIIRYRVPNALRFWDEYDELYWNVTGDEWEVPIRVATATVLLPPSLDGLRTASWTGGYGSTENAAEVTKLEDGFYFETKRALNFREGLTIATAWDPGVVARPGALSLGMAFLRANWLFIFPFVSLALMWRLWLLRGKDPARLPISPQYEPPDGLTPAEVGTLVDNRPDMRDVSAALVDLAVRGYLRFEEVEKTGVSKWFGTQDYRLVPLKDRADWADLRPHEREILSGVFGSIEAVPVRISELQHEFYTHLPEVRKGIFAELVARKYYARRPDKTLGTYVALGIGVLVAGIALGLPLANAMQMSPLTAVAAAVLTALPVFAFGAFMPARTVKGTRVLERILGFEDFLDRVESDRFRRTVRSPEMFERFLPYAMALGVERKWAKAFDDIYTEPPSWYVGSWDGGFHSMYLAATLGKLSTATSSAMSSGPRSSGGSGFGGGGGFSGGGFSGGGFGGGGGGGW